MIKRNVVERGVKKRPNTFIYRATPRFLHVFSHTIPMFLPLFLLKNTDFHPNRGISYLQFVHPLVHPYYTLRFSSYQFRPPSCPPSFPPLLKSVDKPPLQVACLQGWFFLKPFKYRLNGFQIPFSYPPSSLYLSALSSFKRQCSNTLRLPS